MRVLIVEDSPSMRLEIKTILSAYFEDCQIDEATDGIEGLKQLNSNQYQLVLTDINMPQMDGLKLVSMVRQDQKFANIPILIITSEVEDGNRDRAFQLGANAYIKKPIQTNELIKKIKELAVIN